MNNEWCIMVNDGPGKERCALRVTGSTDYGAHKEAMRRAPAYGPASRVTVDRWPPLAPVVGHGYETAQILRVRR